MRGPARIASRARKTTGHPLAGGHTRRGGARRAGRSRVLPALGEGGDEVAQSARVVSMAQQWVHPIDLRQGAQRRAVRGGDGVVRATVSEDRSPARSEELLSCAVQKAVLPLTSLKETKALCEGR